MASDPPEPAPADVRALRLLLELREKGFACDSLKVGDVELVGVKDYLPHPKAQLDAAAAEERGKPSGPGGYMAEFGADLLPDGASRS